MSSSAERASHQPWAEPLQSEPLQSDRKRSRGMSSAAAEPIEALAGRSRIDHGACAGLRLSTT